MAQMDLFAKEVYSDCFVKEIARIGFLAKEIEFDLFAKEIEEIGSVAKEIVEGDVFGKEVVRIVHYMDGPQAGFFVLKSSLSFVRLITLFDFPKMLSQIDFFEEVKLAGFSVTEKRKN